MARYIDADKFILDMTHLYQRMNWDKRAVHFSLMDLESNLGNIKTADVRENVRGAWTNLQISITGGSCADCSICGATVHDNFTSTINFCPNCGADMRGEHEQ